MNKIMLILSLVFLCISCVDTTTATKGLCDMKVSAQPELIGKYVIEELGLEVEIAPTENDGVYTLITEDDPLNFKTCKINGKVYADFMEEDEDGKTIYTLVGVSLIDNKLNLTPLMFSEEHLNQSQVDFTVEQGELEVTYEISNDNVTSEKLLEGVLPAADLMSIEFSKQ